MKYVDFIKTVDYCPFCNTTQEIFAQTKKAYLTLSIAPYHPHHLLVIPKRHVRSFLDLKKSEKKQIDTLIESGCNILVGLGYTNYTVIVREGYQSGKSVEHLHYHLIPTTHIGDLDHDDNERSVLSADNLKKSITEIYSVIKN